MTDRDGFIQEAAGRASELPRYDDPKQDPPPRIFNALEAMQLTREAEARGDVGSITTGWPTIDGCLDQRIRPGELVVLGARTGVGKTWAVQQIIEHAVTVDAEAWAILQTLEMPVEQMGRRIAAHVFNTSPRRATARLDELDDEGQILKLHPHLPRFLLCEKSVTVEKLEPVLKRATEIAGDEMTMLAVDYFGLLGWPPGRGSPTTYEKVSENAKLLKALTLDYNIVCLAAVQLTRAGGKSGTTEPNLQDLRDSGVIEEASDRIMLLWRNEDETVWIKLAKNRFGPIGASALLAFDESRRFHETHEFDLADGGASSNPRTPQDVPF